MTTLNAYTGDDSEADVLADEREVTPMESRTPEKAQGMGRPKGPPSRRGDGKCPECGFKASLTEAEDVVGMMGGHMPGVPMRDVLLRASGCR